MDSIKVLRMHFVWILEIRAQLHGELNRCAQDYEKLSTVEMEF